MKLAALLALLWPAPTFRKAASERLHDASPPLQADLLWPRVCRHHARTAPAPPAHGFGVRLLIAYLRWCLALYRCLREQGVDQATAFAHIEAIQWRIVAPLSAHAYALSRLRSASPVKRLRWTLDMSFSLLFTRPFRREVKPCSQGAAFLVTRCPFADYLREQGAPELTGPALCALDRHMAAEWGVEFRRSQTIAGGASHCDFEFRVPVENIGRHRAAGRDG